MIWLDVAAQARAEEQDRAAEAARQKAAKAQAEERNRLLACGAVLTAALRAILGEESAAEILSGADTTLIADEVRSGEYTFLYAQPTKSSFTSNTIHAFGVRRDLPDDVSEYFRERDWIASDFERPIIKSAAELGKHVAYCDQQIEKARANMRQEAKERAAQAAVDDFAQAVNAMQRAVVEDQTQSKQADLTEGENTALYLLRELCDRIENEGRLSPHDEFVWATAVFAYSREDVNDY